MQITINAVIIYIFQEIDLDQVYSCLLILFPNWRVQHILSLSIAFKEMLLDKGPYSVTLHSPLNAVFRIRIIWSDPDPDPYQETIDMDPGSVKN